MTYPTIDRWADVIRGARRAYKDKLRIEQSVRRALEQTDAWIEYDTAVSEREAAYDEMVRTEQLAQESGVYLPWE